jgi:hypothetical protein
MDNDEIRIDAVSSNKIGDGPIPMPPQNLLTEEMVSEKVKKCGIAIKKGLDGRSVTVRPVSDDGNPVASYRGSFVCWARGYYRAERDSRDDFGTTTDAIVMDMNGQIHLCDPKWIRFEI